MKSLRLLTKQTKSGVASLYIVIFATILFGVTTLSFARIILSESTQTSNDDLSQSAYDSAMAGVEDAKYMVNQYYRCLNGGGDCSKYNIFNSINGTTADSYRENCDKGFALAEKMHNVYPDENGVTEVKIQETSQGTDGNNADQAYTCVVVSDIVPDYRSTLTSDTRVKVIPLGTNTANGLNSTDVAKIKNIEFGWYSSLNQGNTKNGSTQFRSSASGVLPKNDNRTIPPTLSLTLLAVDDNIDLNTFHQENNTDRYLYSQMLFLPTDVSSGTYRTTVLRNAIYNSGNASSGSSSNVHNPFDVSCSTTSEFACNVSLEINDLFSNKKNVFLIVSLPYGDPYADFSIRLLGESGSTISLQGVQVSVDSTGRTNQLYRRVETRLDVADLFFPYPQYSLELGGEGGDSELAKNLWVTYNCWYSQHSATGGVPNACNNNGRL